MISIGIINGASNGSGPAKCLPGTSTVHCPDPDDVVEEKRGDRQGERRIGVRRRRLHEIEQTEDVADEDEDRQTQDERQELLREPVADDLLDQMVGAGISFSNICCSLPGALTDSRRLIGITTAATSTTTSIAITTWSGSQ